MKSLKQNKRSFLNLSLLLIIIIPYSFTSLTPKYKFSNATNFIEEPVIDFSQLNIDNHNAEVNDWDAMVAKYDINKNGISDVFDKNLKSYQEREITIVIQFPEDIDCSLASTIFENEGGYIMFTYEYAINGFAGTIDHNGLHQFSKQLRDNDIEFLMDENHKGETHLYYTSRNMNLRPYVWKTLGYDGDDSSSIAVLDTGIDESHEFFDNYSFGDFDYKIIGWKDFTAGGDNDTVSDYDGHGSHTAGIAAGLGTPVKSGLNRSIATHAENRDYSSLIDDPDEGDADVVYFSRFDVSSLGEIEIECQFNDSTPLPDFTIADFYLVRNDIIVEEIVTFSTDWQKNMTYTIDSSNKFGKYFVAAIVSFWSGDANTECTDANFTVRAEAHWPFSPSTHGCGNIWKGVAPDTHIVAAKVIPGGSADIIRAIDWVISNRTVLNITVMSMSIGLALGDGTPVSDPQVIAAVNKAVENGIVTVVSAGNDRNIYTYLSSPADADNVITVAANNFDDEIAYYSSQGTTAGNTIKPDITAPGGSGSVSDTHIFSADSNDNDAEGAYRDTYDNDLYGAQGTSMSCPAVAGAANLLIEAMGGANKWNWTDGSKSKLVKALLLMTATETYPLKREGIPAYSPTLNRGGKDIHEGYGRINVDAAIEAWIYNWTTNITNSELLTADLYTSSVNSSAKHAKAGYVELQQGQWYIFNVSVPSGKDYDLYLYNSTYDKYGEPVMVNSSTSSVAGKDEILNYTAEYTGKYFVVIKAIGEPLAAPLGEDDDDDDGKDSEAWDLVKFLVSPLGLLLVVGIVAAVVILIVLVSRREKEEYIYRPEY